MTTAWSQTGGPGTITFGNTPRSTTTASFSTNGVYNLQFQATKGALSSSAGLTVVVGNVPYGPTLNVRFPFDDAGPGTTTPSDTSGGGANVTLQMINQSGGSTNLHGAANSGVAGLTNPNRALNLSSNPNQGTSGVSGNFAAVTNSALGFGNVTNFVVTMWMKQLYFLPANIGPRMFILGNSTNTRLRHGQQHRHEISGRRRFVFLCQHRSSDGGVWLQPAHEQLDFCGDGL